MSVNIKRAAPSLVDDDTNPMDLPEVPTMRPVKQVRLETSLDVHETSSLFSPEATNMDAERNKRRVSEATLVGEADYATALNAMKAKIIDLESKLAQIQHPASPEFTAYLNGDVKHFDNVIPELNKEEHSLHRKPAKPLLNRVTWVPFKSLYLDEDVYAVDVLMGSPKFYWQRRGDEREIKDRLEAAKTYNAGISQKIQEKEKEKTAVKAAKLESMPKGQLAVRKEMPERIRINSQPVLAILADITGEKWGNESKVILRPYKILVAYEMQIRERFNFLKKLWNNRPRPDDVTTSASAVTTYEPETLDDDKSLYEGSSYNGHPDDATSVLSHEQQMKRKIDLTTTYDALQDLECLIEFMDKDLMPVVRQYAQGNTYPKVYFRDLWYLYQPGDWVVLDERRGRRFSPNAGPEDERPPSQPGNLGERAATIWRVLETVGGRPKLSAPNKHERNRPPSSEVNPFCVRCYRIDYDGDRFGPIWVDFDFHPWQGEKNIEQLEIVPLRLIKDEKEKKERYIKRGKQFMQLTTPQHRVYSGPLLNFHPSGLLFEHVSSGQRDVYGSVIVDFKETARVNPKMVMKLGISCIERSDEDLTLNEQYPLYIWEDRKGGIWKEGVDEIHDDSHIDEHLQHKHIRQDPFMSRFENLLQGDYIDGKDFGDKEYALLPNRVCAYILQRRRFAILKLDCLRPQGPDPLNWNDLFLARDNKETVKAQTMSHFRNKRLRAANPDVEFDLSREKGLGLIILLHGVPGVGKTSTAECVAQLLGKPLFPITCGDLGTTAEQVEQQLYEIFGKAEKWDCVLLLDEADVFLSARGKNDLKRNAVVSVFLRILELYTGILFLTTNRIGVLDEAFMSRIHTQLYYPPLEEGQSLKIWETNLRKLEKRKRDTMKINTGQILQFARIHFEKNVDKSTRWNGRQIRNACQAAAALAEHEAFGTDDVIYTPDVGVSLPIAQLEVRHFHRVDNAVREFHDYMTNVCGEDFAGIAKMKSERDDDFEPARRYPDQYLSHDHSGGASQTFLRPEVHSPAVGSTPYGGPYDGPRGSPFSPQEPRSRQRWGSSGRDQERSYFPA